MSVSKLSIGDNWYQPMQLKHMQYFKLRLYHFDAYVHLQYVM